MKIIAPQIIPIDFKMNTELSLMKQNKILNRLFNKLNLTEQEVEEVFEFLLEKASSTHIKYLRSLPREEIIEHLDIVYACSKKDLENLTKEEIKEVAEEEIQEEVYKTVKNDGFNGQLDLLKFYSFTDEDINNLITEYIGLDDG